VYLLDTLGSRMAQSESRQSSTQCLRPGSVQVRPRLATSVANPANLEAFLTQAERGSLYVEFSVPSTSVRPGGKVDWGIIPGPGSVHDRLNPVSYPVPAWDIEHVATKIK
jgi:hypothetical protein